jgi:REP element-mobilizing transposase RayT
MNSHSHSYKQGSFFKKEALFFGGSLLKNSHARSARPLSSKELIHIVLKSDKAVLSDKTDLRLTSRQSEVERIIKDKLISYGIKIYQLAIASNHIHILISFKNRRKYFSWVKKITGLIARKMLKAEKGSPARESFWTYRPFTRVVYWGRDFRSVMSYIKRNILEAIGAIAYTPRSKTSRSRSSRKHNTQEQSS